MKVSISQLTTFPAEFDAELHAYRAAGFRAVEISLEKVGRFLSENSPSALQERLHGLGIVASGAIGLAPMGPALLLSEGQMLDAYLSSLRSQLELCRTLQCKVLGIGADARRFVGEASWRPKAVENLRLAATMAADHDVRLALEFMSLGAPIGPFVLDTLADAKDLVQEAARPAIGLSIDFFHHFRSGGTASELGTLKAEEIANVHVTDVRDRPAERLDDGDRMPPGAGVAPLTAYRDAILETGYQGYWTLELLNPDLWRLDVAEAAALSAKAMEGFAAGGRKEA